MSACDKLTGTLTLGATMSGSLLVAKGDKGDKGDAYIITEADKQEIKEALSGDISELKSDLADTENLLIRTINDNLLKGVSMNQGKKQQWNSSELIDADDNFYVTDFFPVSYADCPLYIVDKDFNLVVSPIFSFFDANKSGYGIMGLNKSSPSIPVANADTYCFARFTLDRSKFAGETESGEWAFIFKRDDYEKRLEAKELYLKSRTQPTISEELNSDIVSEKHLEASILKIKSNNIYDKSASIYGTRIDALGKPYIPSSSGKFFTNICKRIKPNTEYYINYNAWYLNKAFWLDSNGVAISNIPLSNTIKTAISPPNAFGLISFGQYINEDKSDYINSETYICENANDVGYDEFDDNYIIKPEYLIGKNWSKYKYYAIGDSKTFGDGVGADKSLTYPKVIQKNTGIQCVNGAKSGAKFCKVSGDSVKTMFEQALEIPDGTDIVTVWGGTNDRIVGTIDPVFKPSCERGTDNYFVDDSIKYDVTTFKGAIRQTIKNIKTRCPNAIIIFIVDETLKSPDKNSSGSNFYYGTASAWSTAYDGGESIKDMIESVCKTYHIPVLNIAKCSMTGRAFDDIMDEDHQPFAPNDSLHESAFGNEMIARAVAGEMAKYLW